MDALLRFILGALLLLCSMVSFIPQHHKLALRSNCEPLSLFYVLCTTIVATQDLAIGLALHINVIWDDYDVIGPPSANQWLDVAQHAVTWIGNLLVFRLCLLMTSASSGRRKVVTGAYIGVLLVTLAPAALLITLPPGHVHRKPLEGRTMPMAIVGFTLMVLNPVVTALGLTGVFMQARKIRSTAGDMGALSLTGLVIQTAVFAMLAVSWLWRFPFPPTGLDNPKYNPAIVWWAWYLRDGWAAVNNAIFAIGQGVLFLMAWYISHNVHESVKLDERSRLL